MVTILSKSQLPGVTLRIVGLAWQAVRGAADTAVLGLLAWQKRARERSQLQAIDDRLLADIGLSRADIEVECAKRIWRG